MDHKIEIGFQAFLADGGEEFGSVRAVYPDHILLYVENAGEFPVPLSAVRSVHYQKVIFALDRLAPRLRQAIGHAHDAEQP